MNESLPRLPDDSEIVVVSITKATFTVQWMLSSVYDASRPEIFIVNYGTTSGSLDMRSPGVTANVGSQTYSTTLTSLEPGTQYFYRIVSGNRFESRTTGELTFQTEDGSKWS